MAVSKRLRYEILRRDNNTCRYCGQSAPDVKLTVDHITPTALGGSDDPTNLAAACVDCNAGKSATPPDASLVADIDQRAVRWAQAMEIAIARRQADLDQSRARTDAFDRVWSAWGDVPRDGGWRNSVERFLASGLDDRFLADAVETAMGNRKIRTRDAWKYFCGICWNEIKKIQSAAAQIVDPGSTLVPRGGADEFEYMQMFDEFLDQLVPSLGGTAEVRTYVDRVLWDAVPEAHKVWHEAQDLPRPDDLEDDEEDGTATSLARDHLSGHIAYHMHQITLWREARSQSDGS